MADRRAGEKPGNRFTEGNTAAQKHGGAGAVDALRLGQPFKGLAAQEERNVKQDLDGMGRAGLVKETAIRLHTASRLYWAAVCSAADEGDLKRLDSYCARFGWLAGASLRAWAQVKAEQPDGAGVLDYEDLLEAQRRTENGD